MVGFFGENLQLTYDWAQAQPQTALFEAAWIQARVGEGKGKANALGGQCAGALAGLAHLRGFKGQKGVAN